VFSRNYATPAYPASNYTGSLAAFAGNDVKIRWRLGTDPTGAFAGWWIDDVAVTNASFRQVCLTGTAANPAEAGPMTASRAISGTSVDLLYAAACGALDGAVYWGSGPITGAPAWTGAACGLGTSGAVSFDPGDPAPGGLIYFVIVGQNASVEGSYGTSFDGLSYAERPEAIGVGSCDRAQAMGGTCP
jgi:hypothetical protein